MSHRTPLDADPNARKRLIAWATALVGAAILIAAVCCGILGPAREDTRGLTALVGAAPYAATCSTARC